MIISEAPFVRGSKFKKAKSCEGIEANIYNWTTKLLCNLFHVIATQFGNCTNVFTQSGANIPTSHTAVTITNKALALIASLCRNSKPAE